MPNPNIPTRRPVWLIPAISGASIGGTIATYAISDDWSYPTLLVVILTVGLIGAAAWWYLGERRTA